MSRSSLPRLTAGCAALTFAAVLTAPATTWAQEPATVNRTFADKPLGIMWHTGFSEARALNYVGSIAREFKFDKDLDENITREIEERRHEDTRPVKGMAIFMVKGFVPAFEQVEFREMADEQEFKDYINKQKNNWGDKAELTGPPDKRKLTVSNSWQTTKVQRVTKTRDDGTEYTTNEQVRDEDGNPVRETQSWSRTTYFRLTDNVMYEGQFAEIHTMPVPDPELLGLGSRRRPDDMYFDVDLEQIPRGFKDLFWNTVSTSAGTWMQQLDSEEDYRYNVRRPFADCGLALIKAVTYDVDRFTVSVRLATDTKPATARVRADVRENSNLARNLKDLRKARPRLPADDDAVFSFHSVWQMPESFRKLVSAIGPMMREGSKRDFPDEGLLPSIDQMAGSFELTGERGNFEVLVSFGGTADSGPALYAGVRFENEREFADGLIQLLSEKAGLWGFETFQSDSGQRYVQVPLAPALAWFESDLKPTHVYLTGGANAVWVAVGGESAFHILERRIHGTGTDAQAPPRERGGLAEISLDFARFVDPEDPAGFDKLAGEAELEFDRLLTGSISFGPRPADDDLLSDLPPTRAFLKEAIAGGDAKLKVVLDADDEGLFIRGQVDETLGRWLVARYMSTVNRAMMIQRNMAEKRVAEAKARAEAERAAQDSPDKP